MRRRMMREASGTFGIRHTTSSDLLSLAEDAACHDSTYTRPRTINDWEQLARISQSVFPNQSPWRRLEIIDETLSKLSDLSVEQKRYIKANFPAASNCLELYEKENQSSTQVVKSLSTSSEAKNIFGSTILVTLENPTESDLIILDRYPQMVTHLISCKISDYSFPTIPVEVHSTPYNEIDSVLSSVKQLCISNDPSNVIIVVPDSAYKRYLTSSAELQEIPLAGQSVSTLLQHEFLRFAFDLLSHPIETDFQSSRVFLECYQWIENANDRAIWDHQKCLELLKSASSLSDYFIPIVSFLEANINYEFFTATKEQTLQAQKAFAVL